jgi:hypothetical protein
MYFRIGNVCATCVCVCCAFTYTTPPQLNTSPTNSHRHKSNDRGAVDDYDGMIPTVLEIPSKDNPYDPNKVRDAVLAGDF